MISKVMIFISLILFSLSAWTGEGKEGHGGDSYALNFRSIAETAAEYFLHLLSNKRRNESEEILLNITTQLQKTIGETRVTSWNRICLVEITGAPDYFEFDRPEVCRQRGGTEKEAINIRSGEEMGIIIGRRRWNQLENDLIAKTRLAIHEYLGMMSLENDDPIYSNQLMLLAEQNRQLFSEHFGNNFNNYVDQDYVCVIRWQQDGRNKISVYEWQNDFLAFGFENDGVVHIQKEMAETARQDGRSFPRLFYRVEVHPDGMMNNMQILTPWTAINFGSRQRRIIYMQNINARMNCYQTN